MTSWRDRGALTRSSLRVACDLLIGRHTLHAHTAGSVCGHWLWHISCSCGTTWRGAEQTQDAAMRAIHRFARGRDVVLVDDVHGTAAGRAMWPELEVLRIPAERLELPPHLRGDGHVVACDGSYRESDEHAGWAAITDAGWWMAGHREFAGTNIKALELTAISHALRLFQQGTRVSLLVDCEPARTVARSVLMGNLRRYADAPSWVPRDTYKALRQALFRNLRVEVVAVRSKTLPLHNIADRLARGLPHLVPGLLEGGAVSA